ncbi:reductase, partial [Sphingomonas sp. HMWF008]
MLTDFVELSDTLPKRALAVVAAQTRCPDTKAKLAALEADYDTAVAGKRLSLLDLLEQHPAAELSLDCLVELSPAIAPRFYSIASSPLDDPHIADLIVGTMAAPAWSGLGEHRGFASGYMQHVAPGDQVFGYI